MKHGACVLRNLFVANSDGFPPKTFTKHLKRMLNSILVENHMSIRLLPNYIFKSRSRETIPQTCN